MTKKMEKWSADQAGEALNALTGLAIWSDGCDASAARTAYQSWWDANRSRLRWDPGMRRYEAGR